MVQTHLPTSALTISPKPLHEEEANVVGYSKNGSAVTLLVRKQDKGPVFHVKLNAEALDEYEEGLIPVGTTISFTSRQSDDTKIPKDAQFMNVMSHRPHTVVPSPAPTLHPTIAPPTPAPTWSFSLDSNKVGGDQWVSQN